MVTIQTEDKRFSSGKIYSHKMIVDVKVNFCDFITVVAYSDEFIFSPGLVINFCNDGAFNFVRGRRRPQDVRNLLINCVRYS